MRIVTRELAGSERVLLEVDLDQVVAARLGEVTYQPGPADLACTADDQRLATVAPDPCRQLEATRSFHSESLQNNALFVNVGTANNALICAYHG